VAPGAHQGPKEFYGLTAYAFTFQDGHLKQAHAQRLETLLIGLGSPSSKGDRGRRDFTAQRPQTH